MILNKKDQLHAATLLMDKIRECWENVENNVAVSINLHRMGECCALLERIYQDKLVTREKIDAA